MDTAISPVLSAPTNAKRLNPFECYLTVWVGLCMVAGIVLCQSAPAAVRHVGKRLRALLVTLFVKSRKP